jgi:serine/threonine protein kinase
MNKVDLPQAPDFDFIRPIGEGGFGTVWLAINRTTGQPRAVKVISRARAGNRDPAGREIASLTRLEANRCHRHPNLLPIHHVGETAEHLFYIMDLADDISGEADPMHPDYRPATLDNLLASGPLDADKCERYAEQLLAALACLHKAGMVHRDVKPANCLFVGGELKLGDFGLLTTASLVVSRLGTLRYMPPDGCMDARADVYAAGLVIYEMVTGLGAERFPSLGDRTQIIVEDRRLGRLNRLALHACDPDPSRRFNNAQEMLAELTADEKPAVRSRHVWRLALAGAITACAALAFFCPRPAEVVSVNFVTQPFEATIYLDGALLRTTEGIPYHTPCTVSGVSAETHHIVFQWDVKSLPFGMAADADGRFDAGAIDFRRHRQITVRADQFSL